MNTQIQRLGNNLAVPIPDSIVRELGLQANDEVEITLRSGEMVLTRKSANAQTLEELLASVTAANRPDEWDMGSAVGQEVW